MRDVIYREDAIKAVWKPQVKPNELIFDALKTAIESEINNVPSADRPIVDKEYLTDLILESVYDGEACAKLLNLVDRPQGEWIYTMNPLRLNDEWECNKCGYLSFTKANYCGHCGCRMK